MIPADTLGVGDDRDGVPQQARSRSSISTSFRLQRTKTIREDSLTRTAPAGSSSRSSFSSASPASSLHPTGVTPALDLTEQRQPSASHRSRGRSMPPVAERRSISLSMFRRGLDIGGVRRRRVADDTGYFQYRHPRLPAAGAVRGRGSSRRSASLRPRRKEVGGTTFGDDDDDDEDDDDEDTSSDPAGGGEFVDACDAELLAWLNSVLFPDGVCCVVNNREEEEEEEGEEEGRSSAAKLQKRRVRTISDLKKLELLSHAVTKVSATAATSVVGSAGQQKQGSRHQHHQEEKRHDSKNRTTSTRGRSGSSGGGSSRGRRVPKAEGVSSDRTVSRTSNNSTNKGLSPAPAIAAVRSSGINGIDDEPQKIPRVSSSVAPFSGERLTIAPKKSRSNSDCGHRDQEKSHYEGVGGILGVVGGGAGIVDAALQEFEAGQEEEGLRVKMTKRRNSFNTALGKRRGVSILALLGSLPHGRKKTPSKSGAVRKMKQDVALLISGRRFDDKEGPKLPGHMESAVDQACAGDVNAVRSLLSMLRDHHIILAAVRADGKEGSHRRAMSCEPASRKILPTSSSRASVRPSSSDAPLKSKAVSALTAPKVPPTIAQSRKCRKQSAIKPYASEVVAAAVAVTAAATNANTNPMSSLEVVFQGASAMARFGNDEPSPIRLPTSGLSLLPAPALTLISAPSPVRPTELRSTFRSAAAATIFDTATSSARPGITLVKSRSFKHSGRSFDSLVAADSWMGAPAASVSPSSAWARAAAAPSLPSREFMSSSSRRASLSSRSSTQTPSPVDHSSRHSDHRQQTSVARQQLLVSQPAPLSALTNSQRLLLSHPSSRIPSSSPAELVVEQPTRLATAAAPSRHLAPPKTISSFVFTTPPSSPGRSLLIPKQLQPTILPVPVPQPPHHASSGLDFPVQHSVPPRYHSSDRKSAIKTERNYRGTPSMADAAATSNESAVARGDTLLSSPRPLIFKSPTIRRLKLRPAGSGGSSKKDSGGEKPRIFAVTPAKVRRARPPKLTANATSRKSPPRNAEGDAIVAALVAASAEAARKTAAAAKRQAVNDANSSLNGQRKGAGDAAVHRPPPPPPSPPPTLTKGIESSGLNSSVPPLSKTQEADATAVAIAMAINSVNNVQKGPFFPGGSRKRAVTKRLTPPRRPVSATVGEAMLKKGPSRPVVLERCDSPAGATPIRNITAGVAVKDALPLISATPPSLDTPKAAASGLDANSRGLLGSSSLAISGRERSVKAKKKEKHVPEDKKLPCKITRRIALGEEEAEEEEGERALNVVGGLNESDGSGVGGGGVVGGSIDSGSTGNSGLSQPETGSGSRAVKDGGRVRRKQGSTTPLSDAERKTVDAVVPGAGGGDGLPMPTVVFGARDDEEKVQRRPKQVPAVEAFGFWCSKGVRLVVEMVGSVEGVVRVALVSKAWQSAVKSSEDRLYKTLVRRAGVTPQRRAAFWENRVLRSLLNAGKTSGDPAVGSSTTATNSSSQQQQRHQQQGRLSFNELARQGKSSYWSREIDADVARTFGRPASHRGHFGKHRRQNSRRRYWWPESLGGAPIGGRSPRPFPSVSPRSHQHRRRKRTAATTKTPPRTPSEKNWQMVDERREEGEDEDDGTATAKTSMATAHSVVDEGDKEDGSSCSLSQEGSGGRYYSPPSLAGQQAPCFNKRYQSTLSSEDSFFPASSGGRGFRGEKGDGRDGEGREEEPPSPDPETLLQLEAVKGQLTDSLRALAVSFGSVGYCQGLDYVVAHLIKCLGTDCHRDFASDPERVFSIVLGLFQGYGLQHIYSKDLEALKLMLGVLDLLIETRLPRLHQHFKDQDVDVAFFAVGWFQTLFLYTSSMPSDTLLWMWDVWVTERSYKVFFRAALAILKLSEPKLLELDLEAIMTYLSRFPKEGVLVLKKEVLVPAALSIKITDSILRKAQRKLDLSKKIGDTSLGWTRAPTPNPPRPLPYAANLPPSEKKRGFRDSSLMTPRCSRSAVVASFSDFATAASPLIFGDHSRDSSAVSDIIAVGVIRAVASEAPPLSIHHRRNAGGAAAVVAVKAGNGGGMVGGSGTRSSGAFDVDEEGMAGTSRLVFGGGYHHSEYASNNRPGSAGTNGRRGSGGSSSNDYRGGYGVISDFRSRNSDGYSYKGDGHSAIVDSPDSILSFAGLSSRFGVESSAAPTSAISSEARQLGGREVRSTANCSKRPAVRRHSSSSYTALPPAPPPQQQQRKQNKISTTRRLLGYFPPMGKSGDDSLDASLPPEMNPLERAMIESTPPAEVRRGQKEGEKEGESKSGSGIAKSDGGNGGAAFGILGSPVAASTPSPNTIRRLGGKEEYAMYAVGDE